ncbi:hypothetical protein [Roseiconus lacunae]|uniref:Uncharacterized protein n=1 Tax=Roseiconus lacunae TaxID=2605694 RepID=A0ABT7PNJ4_9BACT|nr:hypothetical protein [Roseiconus lacunae]MCD0459310.1 hypothetical protein [Roseiconus lacunae]MDM4018087.1 hypothetical protein [Roseiconus lacunae]WRQ50784.1 hypothetical protein U8335_28030 [Stieleria sp. HD01]
MPLRKLWDSIRGKADKPVAAETRETIPISVAEERARNNVQSQPAADEAASATPSPIRSSAAQPPGPPPGPADATPVRQDASSARKATGAAKPVLDRQDKKLCRRLESMDVQTVLEVGVGDGARGLGVVESLTRHGHSTPVCYIAVDLFEMDEQTADGKAPLQLRDFHRQLREYPAKVHLVPMPADQGLDRVLRTYGQVDVIIWAKPAAPSATQASLLSRLSKPTTVMMKRENGSWSESSSATAVNSRKAA